MRSGWVAGLLLIAGLLLSGCAAGPAQTSTAPAPLTEPGSPSDTAELPSADEPDPATTVDPEVINPRVTDFDAPLPPRLLGRDAIRPVYEAVFATAAEAPLNDDELVIGIALEGEAKAYPITVLRFREMVNDELAGWPILVTW